MTKKAVELVTHPRRFLQKKKHPAISQKSVMQQQPPTQPAIWKGVIRKDMELEGSLNLTTKCPVRCNFT